MKGSQLKVAFNNVQGFGLAKQELMKQVLESTNCDLMLIAESKRDIDHPVTEIHHNYSWIGKDRNKDNGGGLGLMYNRNTVTILDDNLLGSMDDDKERMWIAVTMGSTNIAVGATYFPQDNIARFKDVAQELHNELIENIAQLQSQYQNIILVGDFNGKITDFRGTKTHSSNGDLVGNLVEASDTTLLNTSSKCNGRITWSRGTQSSTIDYVICSDDMYEIIEKMIVDEEQAFSVGSDHNVIMLTGQIPDICRVSGPGKADTFKKWNIKDETDWVKFSDTASECFKDWNHANFTNVDDMWADFKHRLIKAGSKSIGYKQFKDKKSYWDKEVHQLIQDRRQANRLFRIWSQHPQCSPELLTLMWEDYQEKKKRVANKVKQNVVARKIKVITQNAAKSTKNPRAFWKMLKRLNSSNDYPLKIRDPDNTDVIIDDPILIKKKLTQYWSQLGNANTTNTDNEADKKLEDLETKPPSPNSLCTVKIDNILLKKAVLRLKNGKAMGTDSIPGEFIKYGGNSVQNALLQLLLHIKLLEKIPEQWYEGIVKPLYKEGQREVLSNYRGITISSVCYKVLVSIIEAQVTNFAEETNIFGEGQGAFRKGRRCEDNLFALKGICSIRKSKKKKTYLAFLDVSKAFDTLNRSSLFLHIWDKGLQGKMWRIIRMLYNRVDNRVIFGPYESDPFLVHNGVKQGCVLSPSLFNMVIEDLDSMLSQCTGISIGDYHLNGLYYADDIVLMAENGSDLQDMLNIAGNFGRKWGLKFNNKKSQVMIIGQRWTDTQWQLGDQYIVEAKTYKYLGVIINRNIKDNNHINDHVMSKVSKLQSYLRFMLAKHHDINRIHFGDTLWRKAILPSLAHSSGIWFSNTQQTQNNIISAQYKMAKAVLKINSMPSRIATIGEMGWLPIQDQLNINRVSYYHHIQAMPDTRLCKLVFNELAKLYTSGISTNFDYIKNMRKIFTDKGLDQLFSSSEDSHRIMKKFKQHTYDCYTHEFEMNIKSFPSLHHYRMVKESTFAPDYIKSKFTHFKWFQLKFKLRVGISGIGEELFRQHRDNGVCKHCGQFESLKHFVFKCEAYSNARQCLYRNVSLSYDSDTFSLFLSDQNFALYALLGDHDDDFNKYFTHYLSEAWTIRQTFNGKD